MDFVGVLYERPFRSQLLFKHFLGTDSSLNASVSNNLAQTLMVIQKCTCTTKPAKCRAVLTSNRRYWTDTVRTPSHA
jgi:hypothetical protein